MDRNNIQSRGVKMPLIIGLVLVLCLLATTVWWFIAQNSTRGINKEGYQAIILNSGQVYFGKLRNTDGAYLRLESAYYTKAQDLPAAAPDAQAQTANNNVSLVKVGDEVYGPENNMSIRAEQVLFWQNLTSDSKVSRAIDAAKK